MTLGPIMMDLEGVEITAREEKLLQNPLIGGVILFTRNFESIEQISELVKQIHHLRTPHLLVSVDHEGGRVQRFHQGFTRIPPMRELGKQFDQNPQQALQLARDTGWLLAAELRACGIDFSFTPVLDLAKESSKIIGDRGFHIQPRAIIRLAVALMQGMEEAGMSAVGKHFPGHGSVTGDSHLVLPIDERSFETIEKHDMEPFAGLIRNGIPAIMPAHIIYSKIDNKPAGFSKKWLQEILRDYLGFQGVIFSDDLSMAGAEFAGDYYQRAVMALDAGCDMLLVCNHPEAVEEIIQKWDYEIQPSALMRLVRMHGHKNISWNSLKHNSRWQQTAEQLQQLYNPVEQEMDL